MPINQRGFAPILVLFLLVAGIVVGLVLVRNPQIFDPKAMNGGSSGTVCIASDPATFKTCLEKAQADENTVDQIQITSQIQCLSKEVCSFELKKRSKSLTIYGAPHTNAGFRRFTHYDYPIIQIGEWRDTVQAQEIHDLTIKDLVFDDGTETYCGYGQKGASQCNSPIALMQKTVNAVIDNVTILHAKSHGIQVKGAHNLTIKNSKIIDSEGNGIWFDSGYTASGCQIDFYNFTPCAIDENKISKFIIIENNLFAHNRITSIEFYAYANAQYPSRIKGNMFVHNHRDSQYIACPPPDPAKGIAGGHCPGGQMAIARSNHVVIEENVIKDGIIDEKNPKTGKTFHEEGLLSSGIELADSLQNIIIKNNKISNHTGPAIFADYVGQIYKVDSVTITHNMMFNNRYGNVVGAGIPNLETAGKYGFSFANNTSDKSEYPFKKAFIYTDPPICTAGLNGQCESTVYWLSNDYKNLRITVKENPGSLFASGLYGKQAAPWISKDGATFEIVDADTDQAVSSTFAKAFQSGSSMATPSPSSSPTSTTTPSSTPIASNGYMTAGPNPCIVDTSGKCSSIITWNFGNTPDIKIRIKENPGSLFASGPAGEQVAPWITESGATFEAYSGNTLLGSLAVKGQKANNGDAATCVVSRGPQGTTDSCQSGYRCQVDPAQGALCEDRVNGNCYTSGTCIRN